MYKSIVDVRQEFLNFFHKKEHQIISSSSLIPENDQTLLFTNSGMNQFKNIFLGIEKVLFKRVVTAQRCMRAGGKHNDLNNVGYTERHLTFFEMLGNFSFGDYFKDSAIEFAWELLTDSNWFALSKDKIWITTHICDNESYDIWTKHIGISKKRVIKIGSKNGHYSDSDNFWKMGNIGPCGPCSEIFYDLGDKFPGVPPNNDMTASSERYVEIWNLVFMQFNQRSNGNLESLPMLSVDTGMGLERITAILQGMCSNYLIDVFKNLIISISEVMNVKKSIADRSLYVIADHIRACAFLIKDGIIPDNEGRGYVLRRIIRRAVCHGRKLGVNGIFFYKLVTPLISSMSYITEILCDQVDLIEKILFNEEKLFENTLNKGLKLLRKSLIELKNNKILSGRVAFQLYSTYGFPLDLTQDICHEYNIKIDQLEFDQIMLKEKKQSKQLNRFCRVSGDITIPIDISSIFVGYKHVTYRAKIIALFQNNEAVKIVKSNTESMVILDFTPFYGESGGQIGDCGYLRAESGGVFEVRNTKKYGNITVQIGILKSGKINVGEEVFAQVNPLKRKLICLNHSATHLLHAALLEILGSHVTQKGSLINDRCLRFDFSHYDAMTEKQINSVENFINQQIWSNWVITEDLMPIESAYNNTDIIMLSKKQYNQEVRVVRIGNFSSELCTGTHSKNTGKIGLFVIVKELGIGAGIRRIEATTKDLALSIIQRKRTLIQNIIQIMHTDDDHLLNKIHALKLFSNKLEKEIRVLKNKQETQKILSSAHEVYYIKNVPILVKQIENIELETVFYMVGCIKRHLKSGLIVLINTRINNSIHLIVSVTEDLIERNHINSLDVVHYIMHNVGGKGGGKSDFAQAKIDNVINKSEFVANVKLLLRNFL
ncbi:alanyl-tRNA synthetase [Candidatus Blochmanniella vafra str. BVAF]|uniref:Alanine--tRNA ligase n=1 Tax=Blochmanniella vafra (strain BVAF) TaxID=859654 RepID=E8Q5T0_BLOVB|nr:alanine--tRNA ligase [Candidatus Blochmannia vafer]ADV33577.1 alanyl-tRNA synthetase [Candidatus Blochmannia vafer str. BVAF]